MHHLPQLLSPSHALCYASAKAEPLKNKESVQRCCGRDEGGWKGTDLVGSTESDLLWLGELGVTRRELRDGTREVMQGVYTSCAWHHCCWIQLWRDVHFFFRLANYLPCLRFFEKQNPYIGKNLCAKLCINKLDVYQWHTKILESAILCT